MTPLTKAAMLAYADDQFIPLEFRPVRGDHHWTRLTGDPVWNHNDYEYRILDLSEKRVHPHADIIRALADNPTIKLESFDPLYPRAGWSTVYANVELYRNLQYRIKVRP